MFEFLSAIISKITAVLASIAITAGLISAPIIPEEPQSPVIEEQSIMQNEDQLAVEEIKAPKEIVKVVQEIKEEMKKEVETPPQEETILTSEPIVDSLENPVETTSDEEVTMPTDTSSQSTQTSTETQVEALTIHSITISSTRTSARIEWQTNKPTESKVFVTSKVFKSISGLSTKHIANITGLKVDSNYHYQIEAISGEQVVWGEGYFRTNPDEYSLAIEPDKTSVPASGWHLISFKINSQKNGENQLEQEISMITPDESQNRTQITKNHDNSGGEANFGYWPKTVGTHTITFSWGDISKSINIKATEYVETNPVIKFEDFSNRTDINKETSMGVGTIIIEGADEKIGIFSISIESNLPSGILFNDVKDCSGMGETDETGSAKIGCMTRYSENISLYIMLKDFYRSDVEYIITIKDIQISGLSSGTLREVQGLPITFHYKK